METDNTILNIELLKKVLQAGMTDETIDSVEVVKNEPATNKGENAMSTLTRLTIKYSFHKSHSDKVTKTIRLIAKAEPKVSEEMLKNLRLMDIFETERKMLEEVLPKIEQLVNKKLAPKMYYYLDKPPTIFMEDLTMQQFKNRNRWKGLNEHDMALVLENLADFHAASVLINEQRPGYLTSFKSSIMSEVLREHIIPTLSKGMINVAKTIHADEELRPLSNKCMNLSKVIGEKSYEVYRLDDEEFSCLNHGDMWIYNLMFRDDDEGKLQQVHFVDYQMCIWTSPAVDLLHFLSVGPELKLKLSHDDIFLEKYLLRLGETMKKIGCNIKPPTMEQLKKSMYKRRYYQQVASLLFYPIMVNNPENTEDLDDIVSANGLKMDMFENPLVKKTMKKILPIMDERQYLD